MGTYERELITTPPAKLLVEWIFLPFMNALFMALAEQNRWPKVSFIVFINTCMALLLNRRSFPVAERTQIRWRTTWLPCSPPDPSTLATTYLGRARVPLTI